MKRVKVLLLILTLCLVSSSALAVDVSEEWLLEVQSHIATLQSKVDSLTAELNATDVRLDYYRQKYNAQRGLYVGGNAAYPIGASGMAMIKFDQWGLYTIGGHQNGFYIGLGGIFKIGR